MVQTLPRSQWSNEHHYWVWKQQHDINNRSNLPLPEMHTEGLIAQWLFDAGAGSLSTTAQDSVGSNHINLNLPTTPNYQWTSRGILLTPSGAVQTPVLANVRTIVCLYKTTRNDSGFIISGGASGSGSAIYGGGLPSAAQNEKAHIGFGSGVRPIRSRNNSVGVTLDGTQAHQNNRGGWVLVFRELSANTTGQAYSFGGRAGYTTSRAANFELAGAWVYNDTLTDTERDNIYNAVRARQATPRGIYIDYRDCPTQADALLIWGQSNADGRAPISGLSAPDQSVSYNKVFIEPCNAATRSTAPAVGLALGTNQTLTNPATAFGPEIGVALLRQADSAGKPLYIVKTAQGSTYTAPSTIGAPVSASNTWYPTEVAGSSIYHQAVTRDWADIEQSALNNGVGLRLRGILWLPGEQDATLAPAASGFQANMQAIADDVRLFSGYPELPIAVVRIKGTEPAEVYAADVRAAMSAFVAANPANTSLIDVDDLSFFDGVHYDAPSMKTVGQRGYNALGLTT